MLDFDSERAAIQSVEREEEARFHGRALLVCGGRDYADRARLFAVLDEQAAEGRVHLILGGAQGADMLAQAWAESRGMSWTMYPAAWDQYGPSAGPRRNARMLAEGKPDRVIAFPGRAGTRDMKERARKAGVEVLEVEE